MMLFTIFPFTILLLQNIAQCHRLSGTVTFDAFYYGNSDNIPPAASIHGSTFNGKHNDEEEGGARNDEQKRRSSLFNHRWRRNVAINKNDEEDDDDDSESFDRRMTNTLQQGLYVLLSKVHMGLEKNFNDKLKNVKSRLENLGR
uniref:Uncharacterized protein n=1 Tax=Romanomermis culicivorax TaxID=13658 RepID=A0A915HQH3_ROMCU